MAGDDETAEATAWHLLLLGVAGRVSDSVLAQCRDLLADGQIDDVGQEFVTGVLAESVPLFDVEIDFLGDALGWTDEADERLAQIAVTESGVPLRYGFAAAPPEDLNDINAASAEADEAAIETTAALAGTIGLWRAWRLPTRGAASQQVTRVYVVATDEDADVVSVTGHLQRALEAVGQTHPQVEVYPAGFDLPSYQRFARAHGELLWSRTPDPGVKIAVLFDEVDPTLGPRFRQDHPTVDDEESPKLLAYLQQGEPLLITTARLDDVVDPSRGNVVPMSFRTDGTWVWSDATTYYLGDHGLLPDPELVAHIRGLGHIPPAVDDVARHRAMAALQKPADEPAWTFGG